MHSRDSKFEQTIERATDRESKHAHAHAHNPESEREGEKLYVMIDRYIYQKRHVCVMIDSSER